MTEEQKENLIAKLLQEPSSLTNEELEAIVQDDELRELYEVSVSLSSHYSAETQIDMDKEWARFRPRLRRKPSAMRRMMRVAAIFLGVMLLSSIAERIIDYVLTCNAPREIADATYQVTAPTDTLTLSIPEAEDEDEMETISIPTPMHPAEKADDLHLAQTSVHVASNTNGKVEAISEANLEEFLRIQQARIANEVAMQNAVVMAEEYAALNEFYEISEDNNQESALRKVTML